MKNRSIKRILSSHKVSTHKMSSLILCVLKKTLMLALVVAMVFAIIGCSNENPPEETNAPITDNTLAPSAEITEAPTPRVTPKPFVNPPRTLTPVIITPIPTVLKFSEGNEFHEYDDEVYEEYDKITLCYYDGNYAEPEEERIPLGANLLLPKGWTCKRENFEGNAYYPNEELASYSLSKGVLSDAVYNEEGECVATIGYVCFTWTEEFLEELESWGWAPVDEWSDETLKWNSMAFAFSPYRTKSIGGLRIRSTNEGKKIECYDAGCTLTTIASYCEKKPPVDERIGVAFPAIVTYNIEYDVGIFVEFANDVLTSEQIEFIAKSIRFGEWTW